MNWLQLYIWKWEEENSLYAIMKIHMWKKNTCCKISLKTCPFNRHCSVNNSTFLVTKRYINGIFKDLNKQMPCSYFLSIDFILIFMVNPLLSMMSYQYIHVLKHCWHWNTIEVSYKSVLHIPIQPIPFRNHDANISHCMLSRHNLCGGQENI